jgi:hypothetical protein
MRSNSTTVVDWRGLFLSVFGWERRIVVLIDYFMCMVVLVLFRTVLNFVA